jgi:hypothetical protein
MLKQLGLQGQRGEADVEPFGTTVTVAAEASDRTVVTGTVFGATGTLAGVAVTD